MLLPRSTPRLIRLRHAQLVSSPCIGAAARIRARGYHGPPSAEKLPCHISPLDNSSSSSDGSAFPSSPPPNSRPQGLSACQPSSRLVNAAPVNNNYSSSSSTRSLRTARTYSTTTTALQAAAAAPTKGGVVDDEMYTTSFAFFEALWDAGVTHCFVNLGSDHPSIIEAMVKGTRERKGSFPRIITCPNEMVAMSMADGYARLSGKPQCVIVHVDVGTQGLGASVHTASTGRAPVLVFAGLSPFTIEGELRGSRTEFSHWMQDVHDQRSIVAQYCRYVAEIKTGRNVKQMVNRALQFARSAPQGPVYLSGAREVMEEEMKPYSVDQELWGPVELGELPRAGVERIADALAAAKSPLVVTGFAARDRDVPAALVELADTVPGLRVLDVGGADMSFPADHPGWAGVRYGVAPEIEAADVIVVLDADVPWIPTQCRPGAGAKIFHIDADPLKHTMPVFYIDAQARYRADSLAAVRQVTDQLRNAPHHQTQLSKPEATARGEALRESHARRLAEIEERCKPLDDGSFGSGYLCRALRDVCPPDTIYAVEAVTNTIWVHEALQPTVPGSFINCGGTGLGWSGGGALGIKLAADVAAGGSGGSFVCQIVGDGSFMFSVPSSVHWIGKRYGIPVLTIVLNNKGWHAPHRSLLLVHPDGEGSTATREELNVSFDPTPDYSGIAKAAADGDLFAARVEKTDEFLAALEEAVKAVQGGQSAVLDCKVVPGS